MRRSSQKANIGRWGSVPLAAFIHLTKKQLAVYAVVASFHGEDGVCMPSLAKISGRLEETGFKMSTKAVSKHICRLKVGGWLAASRRGWGKSNTYTIQNPAMHGEYAKPVAQNGDMESPSRKGDIDSPLRDGESNIKTPSKTPFVKQEGYINWEFVEALARDDARLQEQARLMGSAPKESRTEESAA
jgi:hypothetical protein